MGSLPNTDPVYSLVIYYYGIVPIVITPYKITLRDSQPHYFIFNELYRIV